MFKFKEEKMHRHTCVRAHTHTQRILWNI